MPKVICVLALLPAFWQPIWGQAVAVGENSVKKEPNNRSTSKESPQTSGTKENPFVVDTAGHKQTPIEREEGEQKTAEAKAEEQYHRGVDWWMLVWNAITAIATAALFAVGIGGVIMAIRTLRAIERQVSLQAASMTQWVLVDSWTTSFNQETKIMTVGFCVSNESSFPLAMQANFYFLGLLPNRATLHTAGDMILFPNKPQGLSINLHLTEDQRDDWLNGINGLRIAVHGQVVHTGVAKEQSPLMTIRGNLVCGRGTKNSQQILEHQSIRLIPTGADKKTLFYRLRFLGRKPKDQNQDKD